MFNEHLYNSVLLKTYIELLEERYSFVDINQLLFFANISPYELEDKGHWFTQLQVNRFYEFLVSNTGNPNIAREAGQFTVQSKSSNMLRQYASAFVTPSVTYWMCGKIGSSLSKHINIKIKHISSNKIEIIVTQNKGVSEKPFQCENRIGLFEAIGKYFTNEYSKVEHDECIHKGSPFCKYIVTWKKSFALTWKLIASYFSFFALISSFIIIFILPFHSLIYFIFIFALLSISALYISEILTNNELSKSVNTQQEVAERLINQFNIRYNELTLIKELGEASTKILDPNNLFSFTADALQKRLKFKRGMLMLANHEKTKLIYVAGYGYSPDEEAIIKNTEFSLTKHESRGVFYLAYHKQKPFIIDDVNNIKSDLSERSINYIKSLGVRSFICIPIIYEDKPEGILAFDNSESIDPATQSDISLLIGIAQQLAISLNNARAHNQLKESEERFRNLSENSPDIIYRTNMVGIITYINPAWEQLLGHRISYVIYRHLSDFIRDEEKGSIFQIFNDIINKKIIVRDKNFIFLNDKNLPRYVTFTGAPDLDADGRVIGIVGTLKDLTAIRSMEAQLLQASKMEALGSLTGGVAHDFNNVIQAILGYNQIMMTGRKDSATQKKYHENIQELISRSRELIQQLLLYGRKSDTKLKSIIINDDILNTIRLLSKSISKAINIQYKLSDDLFPVLADSNLISQIIMNLVINARDALGDSGTISIYTNNLTPLNSDYLSSISVPPGYYIRLIVTDTGSGMDKDILQHIFEPFFTTKEVGKGTGLGLSVVKHIVQSLNGYIFCDSIPNKGTTFEILLPAADREIETLPQAQRPVSLKHGKEKLLIVDDESYVLETVKDTLSTYGYKIITADSVDQALKIYSAKKDNINLVLLDLNMPGSSGKKLLLDILKIRQDAKILMTSGYTTKDQINDLINTGASGFIVKPYQTEELLASIRNILDSRVN